MKKIYVSATGVILITILFFLYSRNSQEDYVIHSFEKIQLSSTFYAEGAGIGDLNQDGHPDVISGPFWYEGPDFKNRNTFYEPRQFDPLDYSDNFIVAVDDVNEDGWKDILIVGFPGEEAWWFENPQGEEGHWERHLIYHEVDNESPQFVDLNDDGKPELVFHSEGYLGYALPDTSDPSKPWSFHHISEKRDLQRFSHGFGIGDVNGDGHKDFLMKEGWWENPGAGVQDSLWTHHPADFGPGGAQMYAWDVDGDGLNDIITSLEAHGWGLAWFRQVHMNGEIHFEQELIMGEKKEDNPYGVSFSQPHSLVLVDMDNDGIKDLVSGKRYWAHGPDGDPEPNAPAVLYWFKPDRSGDGDVKFIPYQVDDNSGAGVEIATGDLTGNGYADIVTSNKKGTFIFLNQPDTVSRDEWHSRQPKRIEEVY
ncbi:MAG: VCBS repeat-containing protein [Balneolaceae bacterium]